MSELNRIGQAKAACPITNALPDAGGPASTLTLNIAKLRAQQFL